MSIWNSSLPSIRKNDLLSLQEEMNDFFEKVSGGDFLSPTFISDTKKFMPKVEVRETAKSYVVSAELPGMNENEFTVSMKDNNLIIEGEKKEEWEKVLDIISNVEGIEFLVASGSIPTGVTPDIFSRLSQIARQKNINFIADTSGEALQNALNEGLFLIKPNLNELSSLVGKTELSIEEVPLLASKLIESGKCKYMVVSLGASGAMMVTEKECIQMIPPKVKSISTVGAGDSMVAGITYSLSEGKTIHEAVKYGIACGTAATLNPGTELCHKKDADEIFKTIIEKRIN
jgi:6-phosphofructokinase 2